jgi:DNA repair protein RadC
MIPTDVAAPPPLAALRGTRRPDPSAVRLERLGPDQCEDAELLSLLLGGGPSARRLARRVLDRFGSLAGVSRAHPVELRVAGLAPAVAARLAASLEIGVRLSRRAAPDPWIIRTPADAAEPLIDAMGGLEREELRVVLLDTKNVVVGERTVYRGNLAGSSVRVGEVFRDAVRAHAAAVIVVHNHPSGDPAPSGEDLRITADLAAGGRILDIELLDHLVIGRGRWTSLRGQGALGQSPSSMR